MLKDNGCKELPGQDYTSKERLMTNNLHDFQLVVLLEITVCQILEDDCSFSDKLLLSQFF